MTDASAVTSSVVLRLVTVVLVMLPGVGAALIEYVPVLPGDPVSCETIIQPAGKESVPSVPETTSPTCKLPVNTAVTVSTLAVVALAVKVPPMLPVMVPCDTP